MRMRFTAWMVERRKKCFRGEWVDQRTGGGRVNTSLVAVPHCIVTALPVSCLVSVFDRRWSRSGPSHSACKERREKGRRTAAVSSGASYDHQKLTSWWIPPVQDGGQNVETRRRETVWSKQKKWQRKTSIEQLNSAWKTIEMNPRMRRRRRKNHKVVVIDPMAHPPQECWGGEMHSHLKQGLPHDMIWRQQSRK